VHPNSKANRLLTECVFLFLSTSFHKAKLATVSKFQADLKAIHCWFSEEVESIQNLHVPISQQSDL